MKVTMQLGLWQITLERRDRKIPIRRYCVVPREEARALRRKLYLRIKRVLASLEHQPCLSDHG